MAKLNQLKNIVTRILTEREEARKDDFILYSYVLDEMGVPSNYNMRAMLQCHILFDLPPFGSVTRARRKVQKENPELKDLKAVKIRTAEQEKYKKFSRT